MTYKLIALMDADGAFGAHLNKYSIIAQVLA